MKLFPHSELFSSKVYRFYFILAFSVIAVSPIEMVRTKLQSKKNLKYRELLWLVNLSIRQEGILSMWKGIGPTLLRDVPFSGMYFDYINFFLCVS